MTYKLEFTKAAQHDLTQLDRSILESIKSRLQKLTENTDDITHLPLKGQFAGLYKLGVRDKYRVIYDLRREEKVIVIVRVGKRSDIYRT